MIVDSSPFLKSLQSLTDFPGVLALVGDEDLLLFDCLKAFQNAFFKRFGDAMQDFNRETLYGDKDDAARIMDACATLPLGSERRLVIVQEAQKISASGLEELEAYFAQPNPSTSAVFLWNGKPTQPLLARGFFAQTGGQGTVVRCWKLTFEDRRSDWVRSEVFRQGKEIAREAAELLAREGGESLRELRGEIEKLALYVGQRKKIEVQDVRETMSFRRNQLVWDFTTHLEAGRTAKAGQAMEQCLEQGDEPIRILNSMARSARKIVAGSGTRRVPDPMARKAVQLKLFNQIKESDLALKSGHGPESGIFERLLLQFVV